MDVHGPRRLLKEHTRKGRSRVKKMGGLSPGRTAQKTVIAPWWLDVSASSQNLHESEKLTVNLTLKIRHISLSVLWKWLNHHWKNLAATGNTTCTLKKVKSWSRSIREKEEGYDWRNWVTEKEKSEVLCRNLRIRRHLPAPIVNGGGDSIWKWSNFRLSRAHDNWKQNS